MTSQAVTQHNEVDHLETLPSSDPTRWKGRRRVCGCSGLQQQNVNWRRVKNQIKSSIYAPTIKLYWETWQRYLNFFTKSRCGGAHLDGKLRNPSIKDLLCSCWASMTRSGLRNKHKFKNYSKHVHLQINNACYKQLLWQVWSPHPISSFTAHPSSTRFLPNALVETLPTFILLPPNLSCRTISHVGLNLGPCIVFIYFTNLWPMD